MGAFGLPYVWRVEIHFTITGEGLVIRIYSFWVLRALH